MNFYQSLSRIGVNLKGYCQVFFAHLGITWLVILQMLHVQVRFLTPLRLLDVSESGAHKHQGGAAIQKRAAKSSIPR